jgi:hypothetical protein
MIIGNKKINIFNEAGKGVKKCRARENNIGTANDVAVGQVGRRQQSAGLVCDICVRKQKGALVMVPDKLL